MKKAETFFARFVWLTTCRSTYDYSHRPVKCWRRQVLTLLFWHRYGHVACSYIDIHMTDIVSHGTRMVAGYRIGNKTFPSALSTALMSQGLPSGLTAMASGQRFQRRATKSVTRTFGSMRNSRMLIQFEYLDAGHAKAAGSPLTTRLDGGVSDVSWADSPANNASASLDGWAERCI